MDTKTRIFVTTCAKYASGNGFGMYLDVEDYKNYDDFMAACRKLHEDEESPEFMFTDFDGIPEPFISEFNIDERLWEYISMTYEVHDHHALAVYVEHFGISDDIWGGFGNAYIGEHKDEVEFAEELIEELYPEITNSSLGIYFNYEAFARDIFISDYVMVDGYVFSRR